jgi:hypothetical protein
LRKHFIPSARRPEIREDFRRAQIPLPRAKAAKRILNAKRYSASNASPAISIVSAMSSSDSA